jgi:5-oxopent-3-ene-1,2,5-tricarboxylate decarboxylase / 2-hydroxyhepta-2,4-diene-1,7-dioate isomerase
MTPQIPFLPDGTVYGALLNFRREQSLWAARMGEAPYKAAPRAPVLFIKTANTFSPSGASIALPAGVPEVEVGATLGLVIGDAGAVAGCVLMNDLSIPHASYYRPPVKFKNLDGFLGIGPRGIPLAETGDVNALKLDVRVNGEHVQAVDFSGLARNAATLLADVNDFMTLQPGDVLLLGTDCLADGTRPRVRAGDSVEISAPRFEPLINTFVQEAA